MLTLHTSDGSPPTFLCAADEAMALAWAASLAPLVSPGRPPSYAALLWRRVRLRLDARASCEAGGVSGGNGHGGANGHGSVGGGRLRVLSAMLRDMAEEEAAREAWVRYHLTSGDHEGAKQMGWAPPLSPGHDAAEHMPPPPLPTASSLPQIQ